MSMCFMRWTLLSSHIFPKKTIGAAQRMIMKLPDYTEDHVDVVCRRTFLRQGGTRALKNVAFFTSFNLYEYIDTDMPAGLLKLPTGVYSCSPSALV